MDKNQIKKLHESFNDASHMVDGIEIWYARELQEILGYKRWDTFEGAIEKAKIACENSHINISDHFSGVGKMVEIGSGVFREVDDHVLTRYACYLIAMNGDSRKQEIAYAQSYFAVQARKFEIVEQRFLELERINEREKLSSSEKEFSRVIFETGVDGAGLSRIRSSGDFALFGMKTSDMKKKLGVIGNKPLADFAHTLAIKAKEFAATVTSHAVRINDLSGEHAITTEHVKNNKNVRGVLLQSGIKPEELPAQEDVKKVERKVKSETKKIAKTATKLKKPDPLFSQPKQIRGAN